ncbi:MAG: 16S rRNA (guanine(527)-N(7))-methyltransferase RsmG [Dehalococcoidales bacterium]|nr:16S rRNA (guanine(527)-N(7))-methyltransferase RsmG [Dehalococcoidales bacterium]
MEELESGAAKLGFYLTAEQLGKFRRYYEELVRWNEKINLTAITGYREVQTRHFLDSLTVAPEIAMPGLGRGIRLIDIGTGAGLPGIPLKIVLPEIDLVLLEATAKKVRFLEHLVGVLGLEGVGIAQGRAEELARRADLREGFDVAVGRAVAALPVLSELLLPFCRVGGLAIAPKKGNIADEIGASLRALELLGGRLESVKPVMLEELGRDRYLVMMRKVSPTPPQYPRRAGIPQKRPLEL